MSIVGVYCTHFVVYICQRGDIIVYSCWQVFPEPLVGE